MILKKIHNFFNKYKLIILGCIIFSIYFWNRFLKTRTSKTLPLDLTVIKFFVTLNICVIFAYILISLMYPRKSNDILEKLMGWVFIPIKEFDQYFKSFEIIKKYYMQFLDYLIPKLDYVIIKTNILYIVLWIIPRMILLIALWIDIFVFHQLHLKYYVISIGLLLFLNRYLKFSLKSYKTYLIEKNKIYLDSVETPYIFGVHPAELEPDYDPNDPDKQDITEDEFMYLPFEIFINFYTESLVYQNIPRDYRFISSHGLLFARTL